MNPSFRELCTPAKIYFAIAVIASVFSLFNGIGIIAVGLNLMFAFIWTFVLGWLCKKGFTNISWFLVLLPYIIIVLAMFGIYHVTEEQRQIMRTIKLQGAYGQEAFVENLVSGLPAQSNCYNLKGVQRTNCLRQNSRGFRANV
jgi:hypothetical protein